VIALARRIDVAGVRVLQHHRGPRVDRVLDFFDSRTTLVALILVAGLLLLALTRSLRLLVAFALAIAAAGLATLAIRGIVHARVTPHAMLQGRGERSHSMPSGHTALAFAAAWMLFAARRSLALVALLVAAAIALSRVWIEAHFPSDVAVGALIGIAAAVGAEALTSHARIVNRRAAQAFGE
jgi:undecaprenyl-diphosphatase